MGAGLAAAFGLHGVRRGDALFVALSRHRLGACRSSRRCAGAKLVLPGDRMDGASLHALIEGEGVTFTGGVPTIFTLYLDYLDRTGARPTSLKRVMIGGSAVPRAMAETFMSRYGVETQQMWGMTETCPLGVMSTPTPALAELGEEDMQEVLWTRQGRLQFGIELAIVDEDGAACAWDGASPGALKCEGAVGGAALLPLRPRLRRRRRLVRHRAISPRSTPTASCASPTATRT